MFILSMPQIFHGLVLVLLHYFRNNSKYVLNVMITNESESVLRKTFLLNLNNYSDICLRKQKYSRTNLNDFRWSPGEDYNSGPHSNGRAANHSPVTFSNTMLGTKPRNTLSLIINTYWVFCLLRLRLVSSRFLYGGGIYRNGKKEKSYEEARVLWHTVISAL